MTKEKIKKELTEILLDHKFIKDKQPVNETDSYDHDYGMDSLDKIELAIEIERTYLVSIPDDHLEKLTTVGETIDYLHQIL